MPGQDLAAVDAAIEEEVARFLAEGPTADELERIVTTRKAEFIRGIERVGGFGGKSDILAQNEVYLGDPGFYRTTLARWETADAAALTAAANTWMARGHYALEVHPFEEYSTSENSVDRSAIPTPGPAPEMAFDDFERFELSNGLRVVLAQRGAVPVVNLRMMVNAGYAADQFSLPGTADLAMDMLDEGTASRSALEISDELSLLGATLETGSNLDVSTVALSALKEKLPGSLDLFADVILNPTFPDEDYARLQKQQLATIAQEKVQPVGMALRVFPRLIYGEGHAYSMPFTGSGTEESVQRIDTGGLKEFHTTFFKPNNATLVVVGDVSRDELQPLLERQFKGWKSGDVPQKNIALVGQRTGSTVYLVDRPDSEQSVIFAGHVAPPKNNEREIAIEAMNEVLGGSFNARINMNLREDKHWSYGAQSLLLDAEGQRPFLVYAPVQTDQTSASMAEIHREVSEIRGERPPTPDEVARAKDTKTLTLAGQWETADAVADSLAEMVRFGLPDDHWDRYPGQVRALSDAQISAAAEDVIQPDNMVWVVVGDRAKIEAGIRELGYGDIILMDADGNILQ
jgi:zinc protease